MATAELYISNLIGAAFVRISDDWWIMPLIEGGWANRRPWDVAKPYKDAIIRRGDRYNIIEANSWHMSTYYGIPAEHVDTRAARERLGID